MGYRAKTKIELGEGARKRGREPVDILLMPPYSPLVINLGAICQQGNLTLIIPPD